MKLLDSELTKNITMGGGVSYNELKKEEKH